MGALSEVSVIDEPRHSTCCHPTPSGLRFSTASHATRRHADGLSARRTRALAVVWEGVDEVRRGRATAVPPRQDFASCGGRWRGFRLDAMAEAATTHQLYVAGADAGPAEARSSSEEGSQGGEAAGATKAGGGEVAVPEGGGREDGAEDLAAVGETQMRLDRTTMEEPNSANVLSPQKALEQISVRSTASSTTSADTGSTSGRSMGSGERRSSLSIKERRVSLGVGERSARVRSPQASLSLAPHPTPPSPPRCVQCDDETSKYNDMVAFAAAKQSKAERMLGGGTLEEIRWGWVPFRSRLPPSPLPLASSHDEPNPLSVPRL